MKCDKRILWKPCRWILAVAIALAGVPRLQAAGEKSERQFLSGKGPGDGVQWEFFCSEGRRSGKWDRITVPSNWELEGFGNYNYGHDSNKHAELGRYRHRFTVPAAWKGRSVRIVFDGVMTDCEVKINGESAGPVHQGGFYRFRYDVGSLLNYGGGNTLEVEVRKVSQNRSVEIAERKADYWVFGGIFRPVFLEALPANHIDRIAIDAGADGRFHARVFVGGEGEADRITARVETLDRKAVGEPISAAVPSGAGETELTGRIESPRTWSAETPALYQVRLRLLSGERVLHEVVERFGFRTIEVRRGEGIFANGHRIVLKGVNRHSFRPETGRALDPADCLEDVELMKSMNMNAVRCSHYPPDKVFLERCDELGLYVIDELCTWQRPALDTEVARKLVRELVERDVNHPCVLFWSNGNEGGWNTDVDGDYHLYDPQKRPVLHPWDNFSGVETDHYETYASTLKLLEGPDIHMPTEFLHGLYDGGHGAGLEDYWKAMTGSKCGGGGFLWVLADEGVVRTDRDGAIDTDGNHAPDGIVGPHHEKEGSFDSIREIWSPVRFAMAKIPEGFDGSIPVVNAYDILSLDGVEFAWELVRFPAPDDDAGETVTASGTARVAGVKPGAQGVLRLKLPADWNNAEALRVAVRDGSARMVFGKAWPVQGRKALVKSWLEAGEVGAVEFGEGDSIGVRSGRAVFAFSRGTGQLLDVLSGGIPLGLRNGPRLAVKQSGGIADVALAGSAGTGRPVVRSRMDGTSAVVETRFQGSDGSFRWTVRPGGVLRLDYSFPIETGRYHYAGVAFDLDASAVKSKRWLGGGPFRVWQNRMAGPRFGLWKNEYNDGIAGEDWQLPEFKGCFKDVFWMTLGLEEKAFTVAPMNPHALLGVLQPRQGTAPKRATWNYPDSGGLFFFDVISAVGTKFHSSENFGPQSQPVTLDGPLEGTVFFKF